MAPQEGVITILHFNDCYNVEAQEREPVGGAARFSHVIKSFSADNPLVLFSGDIFAPSIMSTFTKGEQMIPVLKAFNVHCAVFGNHDFDFGVDNLVDFTKQTPFPWLMSNVIDNETKRPLAEGLVTHVIEWGGKKIGLVGLVEFEWLATLATIDADEVTYLDFVQEGRKLARQLKDQQGVDYVIALTHMRTPNDVRLAENVDEIDLILGGHDHVYEIKKVNGKYIVKSGTDFRQMSKLTLTFNHTKVDVNIEEITLTSKYGEDEVLLKQLEKYTNVMEGKMDEILGSFSVDLDGRFSSVRTMETNLGNFVCDVMLSATHADLAILNSGTLRADMLYPKGDFKFRDLLTVLPFLDPLVVLSITGRQLVTCLENSVSQYPKLEGRFPQVAGISFAFDPTQPPGSRIDPKFIKIGDEYMELEQKYRLATKAYLQQGRDGYDVLKECEVLLDDESSPELCTAVQNHFHAIKVFSGVAPSRTRHRQSLVCLSRRHSVVKMLEGGVPPAASHPLRRGVSLDATARRPMLKRQTSLDDIERETCRLEPKVEGRILLLTDEIKRQLEREKQEAESLKITEPIEEVEETSGGKLWRRRIQATRELKRWLRKLMIKGFKKSLQAEDLYKPLQKDEANVVYHQLQREWDHQQEREDNSQKPSLKLAIWNFVGRKLIFLGFLYFIRFFVLASINVFCMSLIIRTIECGDKYDSKMIIYVLCLITSFTISFLLIHNVGLKVERINMRMRVACCSMVFRKALRLSKSLMASASAGKLFNIIAGDVAKFDQLSLYTLGVWVDPIGSVAVLAYLYPKYGVAVLPGIGVLYLNALFQLFQAKMFSSLRMKKSMATDERLKIVNGVLSDIKAVKMYSWETPFSDVIKRVRRQELRIISSTMILRVFNMVVYISGSKFPLFLAVLTALYLGQSIRAEMVFVTYALYNILKLNLTFTFPNAVQKVAETLVSVRRIQDILNLEEKAKVESTCIDVNQNELCSVIVQDLTVSWTQETTSFLLSNIFLSLSNHELCFVTGPVGSGKSSLLLALLGEMLPRKGTTTLNGKMAYVSQEPWLFPASIRKNIVFSLPFDEKRYRQVLDACALLEDLNHFPDGDASHVGDKGVTLSGGQKARIHLARSIYHQADIYLLDDCLSAVDARVGNHIFKNCINGLISNSLRILVTHQLQYILPGSYVVSMNMGRISKQGKYEDMGTNVKNQDTDIFSLDSMDVKELQEKPSKIDKDPKELQKLKPSIDEVVIEGSSLHAYRTYCKSVSSWIPIVLFLVVNVASQLVGMSYEIWLTIWTQAESRAAKELSLSSSNGLFPNQTSPDFPTSYIRVFNYTLSSSHDAFMVFVYITIAVLIITVLRTSMFFGFTFAASTTIHNKLMKAVLRSKMAFFNANPLGRIVNRFSKDMEAIDDVLPAALFDEITEMSTLLEVVAIVIYVDIWLGIPIIFLVVMFVFICMCYFRTAIFIKRIEAIRRSPVFTLMSNSIQGQVTIRAHKAENVLAEEFDQHQDSHSMTWFLYMTTTRYLSVSMEALLSIFITVILIAVIITSEKFTGSEIGLLITLATKLTTSMQWGVKQAAETENQITSVERIDEYSKLPPEDGYDTKMPKLPKNWPQFGAIKFDDVSLSYSLQEPAVLKNLRFEIKGGEKVGVVGRTGAGKSSLISALFRLAEIQGNIEIDGVSTTSVPLQFLRRAFSIIPQDPVLFVGSVRYNLDPFCQHSDETLWQALEEVQIKATVQGMDNGLNSLVSEGGSNFSVGQRQLLCLSRAILRKSKIILLDEATSNCDKSCDTIIQSVLRKRFSDCTILIIAHRLDTIIDCDKVMIMDEGHLIEFDEPFVLLQQERSAFKNLVDQTGKSASSQLMNLAQMHHLYKTPGSSKPFCT